MKAKTEKQLKQDGFIFAGLFGIEYPITIRTMKKLLKPYGLALVLYNNRQEYGDQSFVKIEYTKERLKEIMVDKHAPWCNVNNSCNCGAEDD